MNILINQPCGMGDVFFCQKIADIVSQENNVYWPVDPNIWNSGANRIISKVNFGLQSDINIPSGSIGLLDLSNTPRKDPTEVMRCKYEYIGLDYSDWADYLKYTRDVEKENELKKVLGIVDNEPFILVNKFYSVYKPMNGVLEHLPEDYDGKIVYMDPTLQRFNIFDWCWIFENAEEIHSVDTSIHYVIETLETKATKFLIHPRHYKYSPYVYTGLLKKPWQWIQYDRDSWKKLTPMEEE